MQTRPDSSWWASRSTKPQYAPSQVRRWSVKSIIAISLLASLILWLVTTTARGSDMLNAIRGPFGSVAYAQSIDAVLEQCGRVFVYDPPEEYYGVYDPEDVTKTSQGSILVPTGPMLVPVYGWMTEEGLDPQSLYYAGEYVPDLSHTMRSMYDGTVVLWYTPDISDHTRQEMIDYVNDHPGTVMIEWNPTSLSLPGKATKPMPEDRGVSFSTWGVSQSCKNFSPEIADQFLEFVETNPSVVHPTQPPPVAELTPDGKLPSIRVSYSE